LPPTTRRTLRQLIDKLLITPNHDFAHLNFPFFLNCLQYSFRGVVSASRTILLFVLAPGVNVGLRSLVLLGRIIPLTSGFPSTKPVMNRFATHRKFALVDYAQPLSTQKEYSVLVAELQKRLLWRYIRHSSLSFQVKVTLLVSWQLDQLWWLLESSH
jgi:hypothetical protein